MTSISPYCNPHLLDYKSKNVKIISKLTRKPPSNFDRLTLHSTLTSAPPNKRIPNLRKYNLENFRKTEANAPRKLRVRPKTHPNKKRKIMKRTRDCLHQSSILFLFEKCLQIVRFRRRCTLELVSCICKIRLSSTVSVKRRTREWNCSREGLECKI